MAAQLTAGRYSSRGENYCSSGSQAEAAGLGVQTTLQTCAQHSAVTSVSTPLDTCCCLGDGVGWRAGKGGGGAPAAAAPPSAPPPPVRRPAGKWATTHRARRGVEPFHASKTHVHRNLKRIALLIGSIATSFESISLGQSRCTVFAPSNDWVTCIGRGECECWMKICNRTKPACAKARTFTFSTDMKLVCQFASEGQGHSTRPLSA